MLAAALGVALAGPAGARSLSQIKESGSLHLCAHPNSLPFASKTGEQKGFQVELAQAIAGELGVGLEPEWIVTPSQVFRSTCDIILDVIGDQAQQSQSGLQVSKPYYRGGLVLVVTQGSAVRAFGDLGERTKVGVQYGSTTAMMLSERHVGISIFPFEDDMLAAVAGHEIDAAVVSRTRASYFNATHEGSQLVAIAPGGGEANMSWNIAVGMRRPDAEFRAAVDSALTRLQSEGAIAAIYGKYGVSIRLPE